MRKAIWSKVWLNENDEKTAQLFNECVKDLLENDLVKQLDNFSQHVGTSRLQHSVNVAYYSFLICYNFGLDYKSAARAGLLHDLFLYDWRDSESPQGYHPAVHPQQALENARKITELNKIEEDAIIRHMWPMTVVPPKYRESHIISIVDKYCACAEVVDSYATSLMSKSMLISCMVSGGVYAR